MPTIFIRGNIIWVRYYVDGERQRKSTKLKDTPANIKLVENEVIPNLIVKIKTGDIYRKKPKTFNYYADILIDEKEKNLRAFQSRLPYFLRVVKHFDGKDIDTITRLDIKQYLNSLDMKSVSKNTYKSFIKEVFELAVDDEIIANNPALNIKFKADDKNEIDYFTKEQVNLILKNSYGIIKPYLYLAFNTGMRPEEILGLQYKDIQDNYIDIRRVRTKGRIDIPKTKCSIRKIPLANFVREELLTIRSKSLFIFGDLDDSSRLRYQWGKVLSKSKLEHKKLYCTRHTFATLMLKDNIVSINELAGLLGHSSPKVTLSHYASVINPKLIDLGSDFNLFGHNSDTVPNSKVI